MTRRLMTLSVLSAALGATGLPVASQVAFAQVDAAEAYRQGKTAFAAGDFAKARDAFASATQTDPRNAEAFLWLGKAQYQLGRLDEAMAAWKATLELAPNEPYAAQMLGALRGKSGDAEATLKLLDTLLTQELYEPAGEAADRLLKDKALTDAQRVRAMTQRAAALLGIGRLNEVQAAVDEILVRYPAQADPAQTTLLLAVAQLRAGGDRAADALASLRKLATDHADSPAAATAQYELAAFDLEQGVDAARVEALARWATAHADHPLANKARRKLVDADFALAARDEGPRLGAASRPAGMAQVPGETPLGARAVAAIEVAADLYRHTVRAEEARKLTAAIVAQIDQIYAQGKAYGAAISAIDALLKAPLPPSSRAYALRASARYRTEAALLLIGESALAGKLEGKMPQPLADAAAAYDALNREFPFEPAWRELAALAERVRAAGAAGAWPAKVTAPKAAYQWAMEIALPVVKADRDPSAVEQAVRTVQAVVTDCATHEPPAAGIALGVNQSLLAVLSPQNPQWVNVMWQQVALLDAAAINEFSQNLRAGHAEANARLSTTQTKLIQALGLLVAKDAGQAPQAVGRLQQHLQQWANAGDFATVEEAYAKLASAVPEAQKRDLQLAVVNVWVRQATADSARLAAAGLTAPRRLDESLAKALRRLYELQDNLPDSDPFLAQARAAQAGIVEHYKRLGYYELAEAAIQIKSDQPSPTADAFAQYQLATLRDEAARRDLAQLLKQYKGSVKWTLTEPAKAALAAYQGFIKDHPTDALASSAAEAVFNLARAFAGYGAHDVAVGIFHDFATFADGQPVLSQAPPGQSSLAERARFESADTLNAKAREALSKALAERKPDPNGVLPPPAKLSGEFAASLAAYKAFVADRPQSPLAGAAIGRVMAVALDYARSDAWDVAEGIYASLLDDAKEGGAKKGDVKEGATTREANAAKAGALTVRDPERIEFCRGVCQVGKVMPDHAKEVLAALSAGPGPRSATESGYARGDSSEPLAPFGVPGGAAAGRPSASPMPSTPPPALAATPPAETPADASGPLRAQADQMALAAITRQEARRAGQVAQMRDNQITYGNTTNARGFRGGRAGGAGSGGANAYGRAGVSGGSIALNGGDLASVNATANQPMSQQPGQAAEQGQAQQDETQQALGVNRLAPVLSKEELARQQAALDAAYQIFTDLRKKYPQTATAEQARGEISVMLGWWRGIAQWEKAVNLGRRYLADNPTDVDLPRLRLGIAQDGLAWSAQPAQADQRETARAADGKPQTPQAMLAEVSRRFTATRDELAKIAADFPDEKQVVQEAQWNIATSFLTQARVVDLFSATLARGQYVRAAQELNAVASRFADHPNIGQIPQMLWNISQELSGRGYFEEAITVWNDLAIHYPTDNLSLAAGNAIAQTYQVSLGRPLRAAELYLELNFAHGGNDLAAQNAVFAIGQELRGQKRWVEALRVLQLFVDSFPRHPSAGQALAMVGQIHQTNEAWGDAIAAYRRVIAEYPAGGQWAQEAKWSIADCIINLSKWKDAIEAYQNYVAAYPGDGKVAEANRRISILKDLANYQTLVNEKGSKAYDAQYQIASIVQTQLASPQKAIVEYQKVAANYPTSHLAAEALYAIGMIDLQSGDTDRGRGVMRSLASQYPNSPRADSALFQIGKSFEDEAARLSGLTREVTLDNNRDIAQGKAYQWAKRNLSEQRASQVQKLLKARASGAKGAYDYQEASNSFAQGANDEAITQMAARQANQAVEVLTAAQLADRQDKVNAALRKAVAAYNEAAQLAGGDKAGEALSRMAAIYGQRLGDQQAAVSTWLEIVRQFSGTAVAEEASWQIAQHYEKAGKYAEAVDSYKAFLRNYRRSPKASDAQFFIAENYEHLGQWVNAMDQYSNYLNNFPDGGMAQKAREQINFIKTYRL